MIELRVLFLKIYDNFGKFIYNQTSLSWVGIYNMEKEYTLQGQQSLRQLDVNVVGGSTSSACTKAKTKKKSCFMPCHARAVELA